MDKGIIIRRAIDKAEANGYKSDFINLYLDECWYNIIFSHSFAKAFWGDEPFEHDHYEEPNWQYHLQQLALSKDRIKYLGQFI